MKPFTACNSVTVRVHASHDRSLHNFFSKFGKVLFNE